LKAVTYAFPPGYRENAEEEEEAITFPLDDFMGVNLIHLPDMAIRKGFCF
jgi:hypothetical protein